MAKDGLRNSLAQCFQEVLDHKLGSSSPHALKNLAPRVGVHYQTFSRWPTGKLPIHADRLPLLCKELEDMTLLDWLERQAGRIAYVPPAESATGASGAVLIAGFVKKVGEGLGALGGILETGNAEGKNAEKILVSLDDVIRECLRLKSWVGGQPRPTR
jgi:hypothetical protein